MIRPALLFLIVALLCGCSSGPMLYAAGRSAQAAGYSEIRIESGRYRVTFQGAPGATAGQVADYAMLRAAELAVRDGYDWFRIAERSDVSDREGPGTFPPASGSRRNLGTGRRISTTLEVVFGRGMLPATGDAYPARAVIRTLGRGRGRV